jgi:hypothetical protein
MIALFANHKLRHSRDDAKVITTMVRTCRIRFKVIPQSGFLAWGLIFHLMPAIGLDLLDLARAVAAFDLPARIGQLFIGFR